MIRPRRPVNLPAIDEPGIRYQRTTADGYVAAELEGSERAGWSVAVRAEISTGRIKVDDLGAMMTPAQAQVFASRVAAIAREAGRRNRELVARGPVYQRRARCQLCSATPGVREIRPGMDLIAEHSVGRRGIRAGERRCDGSAANVSDGPAAVAIAATPSPSPRAQVAPPRAVPFSYQQGA